MYIINRVDGRVIANLFLEAQKATKAEQFTNRAEAHSM
jgi:hypothetical protein